MRRLAAAALIVAMHPAPAAATTVASDAVTLPPYVAAYQPNTVDERGLWMIADEEERRLRDSADVLRDPALNAYVRHVLCRAVGAERCAAIRLYILRIPAFNATTYANGMMTVWTGALLRLRSEAELAAMFGHEFGHFERRHGVADFRRRRTTDDVLAWASILGGGRDLRTVMIGDVYRFDRAQEREADLLGLRFLAAAAYPVSAAADIWVRVMAETDATAIGRYRKPDQRFTAGFLATHPTNLTRATYLRAAAAEIGDRGSAEAAAYRAALAPWLPQFLADQIKRNDFGGSEYLLTQLAADGWTTPLLFARGELYRERGHPRDLVNAAGFYRDAIGHGDAPAEAYRGLGLALLRSGQAEPGKAALREYLARKPDAGDTPLIVTLIAS